MQLAGEFELERKHEKRELELVNEAARDRVRALEAERDALVGRAAKAERQAEQARAEAIRAAAGGDDAARDAVREAAAARFALGEALRLFSELRVACDPGRSLSLLGEAAKTNAGAELASLVGPGSSAIMLSGPASAIASLDDLLTCARRAAGSSGTTTTTESDEAAMRAAVRRLEASRRPWLAAAVEARASAEGRAQAPGRLAEAAARGDVEGIARALAPPSRPAGTVSGAASPLDGMLDDALRAAAAAGHVDAVAALLREGADPLRRWDGDDLLRRTPLHAAAAGGHEAACKALIRHAQTRSQAKAAAATAEAQRAGDAGDASARAAAADALASARGETGFLLDALDTTGCSPLVLAARAGHASVCKTLLLQGADPSAADEDGVDPAAAAEEEERTAALSVLADGSVLFWNASVRANRHYSERRYAAAIGAYSAALRLASERGLRASRRDLATLHYNRARAAFRLGRHVAAVEDCGEALDQDGTYRNALAQRAECHMSLFDFERAARDFRSLLDADPSDRQWARRLLEAERMRDLSHYAVLGVGGDFTGGQLKRAYRASCLRWHPDKHASTAEAGHRANVVFRRVGLAYETLQDSYKRMMHDMEVRDRGQEPGAGAKGGAGAYEAWAQRETERDAEREGERVEAEQAARARADADDEARAGARRRLSARAEGRPAAEGPGGRAVPVVGPGGLAEWAPSPAAASTPAAQPAAAPRATSAAAATQTSPAPRKGSVPPPKLPADAGADAPARPPRAAPAPASSSGSGSDSSPGRASRRHASPSSVRDAEAFLDGVKAREEARWRASGTPTSVLLSAGRFAEAAEAKESSSPPSPGDRGAAAAARAAGSPREAARRRVEVRVRAARHDEAEQGDGAAPVTGAATPPRGVGRVPAPPLSPEGATSTDGSTISPLSGEHATGEDGTLPGGLGGFVDQLEQLDEQIKALMATDGAGLPDGFDDVDISDEEGEGNGHLAAGAFGDDHDDDGGIDDDEDEDDEDDEDDDDAMFDDGGRWPTDAERPAYRGAGAAFSPGPAATPRTQETARRAAAAVFAPTDE